MSLQASAVLLSSQLYHTSSRTVPKRGGRALAWQACDDDYYYHGGDDDDDGDDSYNHDVLLFSSFKAGWIVCKIYNKKYTVKSLFHEFRPLFEVPPRARDKLSRSAEPRV